MGPVLFLNTKYLQPAHPKGNQSRIFIGRTDAEAETPIVWPPDAKNLLIWKDPDAGKDWRQEEKEMTQDEMVGQHHWLYGHEIEPAPGVGDRREGWSAAVHGVAKSQTQLSDWTELYSLMHSTNIVKCLVLGTILSTERKQETKSLSSWSLHSSCGKQKN